MKSGPQPPTFRDRVVDFNREIGGVFDGFFYAISDGIDWIEPFLPWGVLLGVILAFVGFVLL